MNSLDWVLAVLLLSYIWGGFMTGLIQSIGGLIGFLVAVIITPRVADSFGHFLTPLFGGNEVFAKIGAFFIIFLIISRLIALAFIFVNKAFMMIAILPGMKILNRLGGAAFGFLEGGLFLGIALHYVTRLPLGPRLTDAVNQSTLVPILLGLAVWLVPLFPKALKETTKVIDQVKLP